MAAPSAAEWSSAKNVKVRRASARTPSAANGVVEGAESCDDGNTTPFDGCSALCLREPNCSGESCTSGCGDGLLINEDCDDGNTIDGDGCSSKCVKETGFTCKQVAQCEKVNGQCVLRVPAIFRDFAGTAPDFNRPTYPDTTCGIAEAIPPKAANPIVPGIAQEKLDAEGAPGVRQSAPGSVYRVRSIVCEMVSRQHWSGQGRGQPRALRQWQRRLREPLRGERRKASHHPGASDGARHGAASSPTQPVKPRAWPAVPRVCAARSNATTFAVRSTTRCVPRGTR